MSKLTRDIFNIIYDREAEEMDGIPSEDLLDIAKEKRLGIDAKIKVLTELVERLYKKEQPLDCKCPNKKKCAKDIEYHVYNNPSIVPLK